jgi:hypothetical protein
VGIAKSRNVVDEGLYVSANAALTANDLTIKIGLLAGSRRLATFTASPITR